MTDYLAQFPIWSSLSKNTNLEGLAAVINDALTSCASTELPAMAAPLLTRQEESSDPVDGWCEQPENCQQSAH